jgi:hypothetical protein
MLDEVKVQEVMGRHLDAARAFWRAMRFEPEGGESLFSVRLVES